MLTAVFYRSSWSSLWLIVTIIGSFSVVSNNAKDGQQIERKGTEQQSWSNLGEFLALSRVNEIEDAGSLFLNKDELILRLNREPRKMFAFPTAVSTGANISQRCVKDSLFYVESLFLNHARWALQMLESSADLPAGIIGNENYHAEGLFDECLDIRSVADRFSGQYCTIFFKTAPVDSSEIIDGDQDAFKSASMTNILRQALGFEDTIRVKPKLIDRDPWALWFNYPSLGLCLPSSCSASDLGESFANLIGQYIIANQSIVIIADEEFCFSKDHDPPAFDGADIAAIWTFGLLGFGVALATIHEAWLIYRGFNFVPKTTSKSVTILHCFSAISNGRKLLSTSTDSADNLSCLHGIRALTTVWLVLVHTMIRVVGMAKSNVINPKRVEQEAMDWKNQIIVNSSVSVDSFLMMSGLLVSYHLLRELERTAGKLRLGLLYLHRYLRLTPVYAIVLFYFSTLIIYSGTGPEWSYIVSGAKACRENWWQHLFYINNLFPMSMENLCMFETWYMAVDTQLFLVAPFFVYSLWRYEKAGPLLLVAFTLVSLAANVAVFIIYDNFPPTIMPTRWRELLETFESYVNSYYMKTWARAPPYMVGLWTGWVLHRAKDSKIHLPQWLVGMLWALSVCACTLIIYSLFPYVDEKETPTIEWAVRMIYGPFHRLFWAVALAWMIIACIHGYGGYLNHFLSWKGFQSISRLSYCIYLIHFEYMQWYYAVKKRKIYGKFFELLTMFFGISVIVFILAFALSVFVEAPFINLEKLLFTQTRKTKVLEEPADEAVKSDYDEPCRVNCINNNNFQSLVKRK